MKPRLWCALGVVCLLMTQPLFAQDLKLPVPVPEGTTVSPIDSYELTIIGQDILIRAVPRVKGVGGFARIGPVKGFGGANFWYNPDGADMTKAMKITEMGFSGNGFSR